MKFNHRHRIVAITLVSLLSLSLIFISAFAPSLGLCPSAFDGQGLRRRHVFLTGLFLLTASLFYIHWKIANLYRLWQTVLFRTQNIRKNLYALFIGCILAFVLLEVFLRVYNPSGLRVKGNKIQLEANVRREIKNFSTNKLDNTIIHTKNSLGFRGEPPPINFDDYLTIVAIGGSTTECYYLSDGKTWVDILGKELKSNFNNLWINNAGLDGHSTYGHIILLENYIVQLNPKIVVFLVGANDVGITRLRDKYDGKLLRNTIDHEKHPLLSSSMHLVESLANYSEAFALILNLYRYNQAKKLGLVHFSKQVFNSPSYDEAVKQHIKPLHEKLIHDDTYLEAYEARLRELIAISKFSGILPVFITQPALFGGYMQKDPKHAEICLEGEVAELAWENLELYNNVIRRLGDEENVLVIDLARELPYHEQYFYDCIHFSNKGAKKVADIVYKYLCPFLMEHYEKFSQYECNF